MIRSGFKNKNYLPTHKTDQFGRVSGGNRELIAEELKGTFFLVYQNVLYLDVVMLA